MGLAIACSFLLVFKDKDTAKIREYSAVGCYSLLRRAVLPGIAMFFLLAKIVFRHVPRCQRAISIFVRGDGFSQVTRTVSGVLRLTFQSCPTHWRKLSRWPFVLQWSCGAARVSGRYSWWLLFLRWIVKIWLCVRSMQIIRRPPGARPLETSGLYWIYETGFINEVACEGLD